MPCTLEPWEIAYEEKRLNKEKFGKEMTDARLLEEVACSAVRTLYAEGKLSKASDLVQAWAKEHRAKDERAGRPWPRVVKS